MEKLITYTLIRLFTKSNNDAIRIFKIIDSLDKTQTSKPKQLTRSVKPKPVVIKVSKPITEVRELHKPISKKEELLESLSYFQNKSYQTKDDKESIRMIKVMLKNL